VRSRRWKAKGCLAGMLALLLAGCDAPPPPLAQAPVTLGDKAIAALPAEEPQPQPADVLAGTQWPDARVGGGIARVSFERHDADDPPRRNDSPGL